MSDVIKKRLRIIDLAGLGILFLLVAATALGGLMPLYQRSQTARQKAMTLRTEMANFNDLSLTLPKYEKELTNTQARLQQAEALLPSTGTMDQPRVVNQISKVAEDTKLKINGINLRPLIDSNNYRALPVEISGSGSWETCYQFMTGLLKMNRLTRLDDVVIQLDSEAQGPEAVKSGNAAKPLCKISLTISTFLAR